MTGPDTFAAKWCHGYGVPGHLAPGALIETLQPVRLHLCPECWRRWTQVHEHPGRHHR